MRTPIDHASEGLPCHEVAHVGLPLFVLLDEAAKTQRLESESAIAGKLKQCAMCATSSCEVALNGTS